MPDPAGDKELPEPVAQPLRESLGLPPGTRLDAARIAELARLGAEFVSSIDRSVAASWKAIAPNSRIRHTAGSRATLARFASGDPGVDQAQVRAELDRLRTLAGGLMSAVERAGEQVARRHLERFAPAEIESMARLTPGAFVAHETKCWRKFVELAAHFDRVAIESEVRAVISEYTERLVEGLGR